MMGVREPMEEQNAQGGLCWCWRKHEMDGAEVRSTIVATGSIVLRTGDSPRVDVRNGLPSQLV
jgi:hypothetical protein